jgi:hypothetical protein
MRYRGYVFRLRITLQVVLLRVWICPSTSKPRRDFSARLAMGFGLSNKFSEAITHLDFVTSFGMPRDEVYRGLTGILQTLRK